MHIRWLLAFALIVACSPATAGSGQRAAGSGILGLDHPVRYDNSGITEVA